MEFLGIGPLELIFILIIILLVIGPRDLQRTARSLGRMINRLNKSEDFKVVQRASQELRNLPQRLAEEARLEDLQKEATLQDLKDELTIGPPGNSPYRGWTEKLPPSDAAQPPSPAPSPETKPPGQSA